MNEFKLKGFVFFTFPILHILQSGITGFYNLWSPINIYHIYLQSSYQFNFQISWTALVTPTMTKETTHDGSKY